MKLYLQTSRNLKMGKWHFGETEAKENCSYYGTPCPPRLKLQTLCDFSVTHHPSPNWTWILDWFGIGSRTTELGTMAWQLYFYWKLNTNVNLYFWYQCQIRHQRIHKGDIVKSSKSILSTRKPLTPEGSLQ